MNTAQRRKIRAKIKGGIYSFVGKRVFKVNSINEEYIRGTIVFMMDGIEPHSAYYIGTNINFSNHDAYSRFYNTKEEAQEMCITAVVKSAVDRIERARRNIKSAQELIDLYPQYAI